MTSVMGGCVVVVVGLDVAAAVVEEVVEAI